MTIQCCVCKRQITNYVQFNSLWSLESAEKDDRNYVRSNEFQKNPVKMGFIQRDECDTV